MNRQFSRDEKQMAGKHIKSIQLTHHQRNASKNYFEILFYPSQNGSHLKKKQITTKGCRQKGVLIHCCWERELFQPHGNKYARHCKLI